ncbi:MAG TPA: RNA polymerase sigma factor [Pseudobacteroides sp.]|uniref:RNA polymerase sigma factor n=1 Tax=Pseudobacteroides sp. TaxID=1968840 RepID=UPI002F9518F1
MEKEAQLVSNILSGDIKSFEILMSIYRNRIYNFLLKMSLSKEDSEDMTQEVFVRVYNSLYQYNSKWCFSTWIFKIAINVFKTEYSKKKYRDSKKFEDKLNKYQFLQIAEPEKVLENMETRLEVLKMLDSLKLDQRMALVLKYVQGFSYKEIGQVLKMSPENAKVRVMRAKKLLVNNYGRFKGGIIHEM